MLADIYHCVIRSIRTAFGLVHRPVVLCAEDDDAIRAVCAAALNRAGFAVDPAADGRQALEKLGRHKYAAVLLDLGLPYVHGATVLSVMRQKDPAILRRLIVVTGINDAALADIEPHVRTVLRKPISVKRLVEAVRDCAAPDTLVLHRPVA